MTKKLISHDDSMTEDDMKDLTQAEVDKLNQQRTTAVTMEPCDLLYLDKEESMRIIKAGTDEVHFKKRHDFLKTIPLFKNINTNHLQPLITNINVEKYRKGDYIQRSG